MNKIILTVMLLLAFATICAADEVRPQVARYVKAYSGDEGLKVFTLRIGEPANGEVLVQLVHVDHPWDGVIHKAKVVGTERDRRYSVTKDGKEIVILILNANSGTVYLPNYAPNNLRSYQVAYSNELSGQIPAEHLLTSYLSR